MGRPFSPQNLPLPMGDLDPHLIHGSRAHPSPQPKRQLDRCSRFCRAHYSVTDRPTDRPTDHATRSVRIGRIYVRSTAMRPKNACPINVGRSMGGESYKLHGQLANRWWTSPTQKKLHPSLVASYDIRPVKERAYFGFGASKICHLLTYT